MKISDAMLEVLGDYFVEHNLINKGWEFHEFIEEWKLGLITMNKK